MYEYGVGDSSLPAQKGVPIMTANCSMTRATGPPLDTAQTALCWLSSSGWGPLFFFKNLPLGYAASVHILPLAVIINCPVPIRDTDGRAHGGQRNVSAG